MTSYYIDPRFGDDRADGRSPRTAWKSWARFAKEACPGDSLLLRRGEVYRLPLPLVGGAAGEVVCYGAYGEGEAPTLVGRVMPLCTESEWVPQSGNLWHTANEYFDAANLLLDGECGNMRHCREALRYTGEWFQHDRNGPVWLYCEGSPAGRFGSIELILEGIGVFLPDASFSHMRFENLRFSKIGTHGIQMTGGASNIEIEGCELSIIGGAIYPADEFSVRYGQRFIERRVRYGNAIETWEDVSNIRIENCRINDVFDGGVCIQGMNGVASRVFVVGNLLRNCGYDSLDVAHGVRTTDVVFRSNTCIDAGEGWALQGEGRPRYSLNMPDNLGYHCNLESSFGWHPDCELLITHNIFSNAPDGRCLNYGPKTIGGNIRIDHNCYFQQNAHDAIAQVGGARYIAAQFDTYRAATGWDTHSFVADPQFRDTARGDFTLSDGSPALGLGCFGNGSVH